MMVPILARPVLATLVRAFVPDASPGLASSDRRLVFIGIDNVFFGIDSPTTASTASPTSSSLRTRFWQNRCMPSSPTCAWFWHNYGRTSSSTVFDKIVFGIDTLFDDCLDRVPVFITMAPLALSAPRRFPRTRGFMCGYLDTGTPDHDIDHGISSHGYLDLGTASRSRLPRHRHKGYHLA
jgi:hypothetical protein